MTWVVYVTAGCPCKSKFLPMHSVPCSITIYDRESPQMLLWVASSHRKIHLVLGNSAQHWLGTQQSTFVLQLLVVLCLYHINAVHSLHWSSTTGHGTSPVKPSNRPADAVVIAPVISVDRASSSSSHRCKIPDIWYQLSNYAGAISRT